MTPSTFQATFLGTGTSQGVPVIGCDCSVCSSSDERDKRLRVSLLLKFPHANLVIDTGPDFRQQMLRAKVPSLDAILMTHEHNDHIIGLDDVRPFNFQKMTDMPVYASRQVAQVLRQRFAYVFAENPYPGSPMVHLHLIDPNRTFRVKGIPITPIQLMHGKLPILGFRIGDLAYLTDMKTIDPMELKKLEGVRHLIVNALHHTLHHSHMNLQQALSFIQRVQPEHAYLTHVSHRMGHYEEVQAGLPPGVHLAYDGMQLSDIPLSSPIQ
jgi:phosphoribosyl 1,2-cyclic phosphate phosphodiesterase